MASAVEAFVPTHPPRGDGPVAVWRGFVGERSRTSVYGWSKQAFTEDYIARKVFGVRVHIPNDPELVQHVLLDNSANYVKPELVLKILSPTIGRGLLTSDGALWREQRRIVAANFAPAAIDPSIPAFAAAAQNRMQAWAHGIRDMAAEATATTMRIISDTLFASDPTLISEEAVNQITAAMEGVGEARLQVLLRLPLMPWSRKGLRAHRGQRYLRETLTRVVKDRPRSGGPDDFLGRLIRQLHEKFEPVQAELLAVDNAATFYLAGHETTANALTWTLYLLSEQPDWQDQAAAEAKAGLADGRADAGLPERLPLLRRILEEALRLYPPAPRMDRQVVADERLGDHEVKSGDIVSIWPWLLHRHSKYWDHPDLFDPDRFLPEARAGRHRFQYLPFGGGPRVCVGARFAMTEALTILAHWLSQWSFSPVPGREVRVSGMVTLRPHGGLPLRIGPRP